MQKKRFWLFLLIIIGSSVSSPAQYKKSDSTYKKCFVGTSLFVLFGNFDTKNPPQFFQLNVGYRLTGKDVLTLSFKTWRYAWPNGIHPFFNDAYYKPEEQFPGYVREFGISVSYSRFLWKGLYADLNVMPTLQYFIDESGERIDTGFQLFNSYRIGYHIKLCKDRFFFQPSLCITHRAYHTALPDGFKQLDDKWSKFVWGEPGLNIGFNF
ncbi:MAG: hypothetical protein MUE33_03250 [Cytophagaceae bacterium]|jgi:hypothetical protein|nr:hypothetical protein [Cytophagaceae bacterium]